MKKIAILIVTYNSRDDIGECLTSLNAASHHEAYSLIIYIVDNNSQDDTVRYIRDHWPQINITELSDNQGYAGGNNIGWLKIRREIPGIDYICILGPDTIVSENFIQPLLQVMETNKRVGSTQPLLLLHPETTKINSAGNVIHYLGFGYTSYNGRQLAGTALTTSKINYASGAAVMLRPKAIDEVGLFESFMFMYLEDLDLGWQLNLADWDNYIVPESVVYHKFNFDRSMRQYYFFERNRWWILLKNYKIKSLLLLFPILFVMEFGQLLFALKKGYIVKKLLAMAFFLSPFHLFKLYVVRRHVQLLRKRSDKELFQSFSSTIKFQPIENIFIKYFANPLMSMYYRFVMMII